jgi:iron complex outermembrane recepter protein
MLIRRGSLHFFNATGALTLAALTQSSICLAQAAAPIASADDTAQIQEIVVTAQHRSENLQQVPISAQVVSGHVLTDQNLNSLTDLTQTVPAVHIGSSGRTDDLYIRGIGSGSSQAFDQSVGTFIDDVYYGRSRTSAGTFLDIDHIEILKGPQSTFFGNNAIAGALNIVTAKPGDTLDTSARLLYGMFGQYAVEGAIGGPITSTLGARVALTINGDSGYLHNTNLNTHWPVDDDRAARVTLVFHPSDNFDATLKAEVAKSGDVGDGGTFQQLALCPPPAPFTAAGFCKTIIAEHLPVGVNSNLTALPGGEGYDLDTQSYVLTANYHAWDHTFTSVTAYTNNQFRVYEAANETEDNGPALFSVLAPERYRQFSEELRVASPTGQTIEYLAGVYLQTDQLHFAQDFDYTFLPAPPPFAPFGSVTEYSEGEHSYAAFGSASWNVTDQLKLSAGLRATQDLKSFDYDEYFGNPTQQYGGILTPFTGSLCTPTTAATGQQAKAAALGLGAACTFSGDRKDKAWLPSAKIQYQVVPQGMLYFSYARGFKAGGFNGADNTGKITDLPYEPEYVNAYELGFKSQWFDNALLFNIDVFRSDYSNLQVTSVGVQPNGSILNVVNNAAASRSEGVELETEWVVSQNFRLTANVTYLDSFYVRYPNAGLTTLGTFCHTAANVGNEDCVATYGGNGNPGPFQDLSRRPTAFAPTWSGSLSAIYNVALPGNYRLTAEATPYFTTGYFLSGSGTDDPFMHQGGYIRWDGRLTLTSPDRRWNLDVIGKNLADRTILTYASGDPTATGSFIYGREMPRNVVVQARYHF